MLKNREKYVESREALLGGRFTYVHCTPGMYLEVDTILLNLDMAAIYTVHY